MNCPYCSAPLLFGSTTCDCGFQSSVIQPRPLEISYWEALRAWWRIYWPTQLVSTVLVALVSRWLLRNVNQWRTEHPLEAAPLEGYLSVLTISGASLIGAACIWFFAPRILGRPYHGFRLVACSGSNETPKLTNRQRTELWFFIWWRQFAGGLLALLLAMPLNMLLGTMKINAAPQIAAAAGLLGIGPIIVKILVGSPLNGFQVETRRPVARVARVQATATLES